MLRHFYCSLVTCLTHACLFHIISGQAASFNIKFTGMPEQVLDTIYRDRLTISVFQIQVRRFTYRRTQGREVDQYKAHTCTCTCTQCTVHVDELVILKAKEKKGPARLRCEKQQGSHTWYLHSINIRSLVIEVQRETVRDLSVWHSCSKPIGRDELVRVIRCQYTPNSLDCMNIFIVL